MKKVTVIRQNRCDQEMKLLLFGCFFIYFAMLLFIGETEQVQLVNRINMLLYLVFVPGFLFRTGYCVNRIGRMHSEERGSRELGRMALCSYAVYFVLAIGQGMLAQGRQLSEVFFRVLTFMEISGSGTVFLAVAISLFAARIFYGGLRKLAGTPKRLFFTVSLLACCALLRMHGETYALLGAFLGADTQTAVPVIPYFAYFLLGMWFEEKKPGFQWKLAGIAASVTAVSALLYGTMLQDLCRLTISLLPVYLVYVLSEALSDVTLRFYAVRFLTDTVELVFAVYAVILFGVCAYMRPEGGVTQVLILAVGMMAMLYALILAGWVFQKIYANLSELFTQKIKHKTAAYFLIYTAVFAVLLLLAFIDFIRFDKTLLWRADGVSQYYPRAVFFTDYIRNLFSNLLHGNFELPMYDFRLGMGGEITYSLEPLYFLFALFGREHTELAYTVITLLRFYLAGITSSVFFLYFKKDYTTTFLASCVYVFCGFSFFGGARHTMFMVPMILFPLLILAMEEIVRGKRWYLCTIFVAVALFSNYYFLYMSTIGMGFYFVVRFFCQKEKEKRTFLKFIRRGLVICGSYLLGVAMACIVLVTTFGLYVGSGRSGAAVVKTPSLFFYHAQWLVRCFLSFLTTVNSPGEWLKLGFLPISFLAIVILFVQKGRKELKLLSVIAALCMAFPIAGFVFNGFSSVGNRWCFMLALLVSYIVADCLPDLLRMTGREKLICAAMIGVYGYLAFFGSVLVTRFVKAAFVTLAVTFIGLLFCQEHAKYCRYLSKKGILILMTVGMVFVNAHLLYGYSGVVKEYTKPGESQKKAENTPLRAAAELEDDSFYRVSTPKLDYSTISSSILFDYNSVSMFNSTFNGSIMEYLEQMGSTGYSVTQLFGLSNRTFLSAQAAVKYYAYYDEPVRPLPFGYEKVLETELEGRKTTVCENQYPLPIGYTYENAVSREELEQYDVLKRQEVLMQRVMLDEIGAQGTDQVEVTLQPLAYTVDSEGSLAFSGNALTAVMEEPEVGTEPELGDAETGDEAQDGETEYVTFLNFAGAPDSETYIVLKNAVLEGNMTEIPINISFRSEDNNLSYKFRAEDDRYGTGQRDYVFNLGYHKEALTSCRIGFDRAGEIKFDSMEVYSQPMKNMEKYTDALTEDILENVEIGTNTVSGTISLEQDKILVLSIPYQNGWTAYVDGEEVELQRANYMYMALPLAAGDHAVRLEFAIPGVKYALVIMPSAVVLFAGLLVAGSIRKRRREKKDAQKQNQER